VLKQGVTIAIAIAVVSICILSPPNSAKFGVDCILSLNQLSNLSVDVFDFVGVSLVNNLLFYRRLSGGKHCNLLLQHNRRCVFAEITFDECIREVLF
jgi:hypothetical protein